MKAFSERNPITLAVVGLVTLATVVGLTFFADDLPVIGGGDTYAANFGDAGGLKPGDDVRIAGVKVGEVRAIDLVRTHVRVEFRVKDAWVGDETSAHIKIKTLLGDEFVDLDPEGEHALAGGGTIPRSRTTTPLDVSAAFNGLADVTGRIDTSQLARSFDTLSATFRDTPKSVRAALTGLSRISQTISSRDAQLRKLADNTADVTASLADSNADVAKLIDDGNLLLQELQRRSQAITGLLTGTRDLARQLSGLVRDNEASLGPALAQLGKVTEILERHRTDLNSALRQIGPYYALLTDATGNGRWVDTYLCGLFTPAGTPVIGANVRRDCRPKAGK